MLRAVIAWILPVLLFATAGFGQQIVWIDELKLDGVTQDWAPPQAKKSVDRHPLQLAGQKFDRGIGAHANSSMLIELNGAVSAFDAVVGVDDEMKLRGSVTFRIIADGKTLWESQTLRGGDQPVPVHVDLNGAKRIELIVTDAGDGIDYDHADWADAKLTMVGGATLTPQIVNPISADRPKIASTIAPPEPQIHGPRVVGATPGRPFLFLVPATGAQPLMFSADGLPEGLSIDVKSGIISGSVKSSGEFPVTLRVKNDRGSEARKITILAGEHKLAQTPPMGWNSWNVWGTSVDAAKIRAAADAFVATGLAAHGYCFVNIDDAWEGTRDAAGNIQTNVKSGDMKALADYVHGKGLKLGIYSSPGPKTCAGFEGSCKHEQQDATTWASWGIDYIKYDWCSCKSKDPVAPYALLRQALDRVDRDIVFSLCQYGAADVWKWASKEDVNGNLWRTTGDITDSWNSMTTIGFAQPKIAQFASPGHWNDPDMLVVGDLGWGDHPRPTRLKPIEQQTHITMWCMLSAPLLIGCDLNTLDDFTRDLLCNDEVLEINQDSLEKPVQVIRDTGAIQIWSKRLFDGRTAIAILNRGIEPANISIDPKELQIPEPNAARDVWTHAALRGVTCDVPPHGCRLLTFGRKAD